MSATVVETARQYYNSDDADNFYAAVWGGEDIHIGLYDPPDRGIFDASRATVEKMADLIRPPADSHALDMGAGYGGAARYLAKTFGCRVECLNLSEVQNNRNRKLNEEQGLDKLVGVKDGSFEDAPYADGSFDFVWSQDAILHSGNRPRVLAEAARVLVPGGRFIFTDPMRGDDCPPGVLEPILNRIHLADLGSPKFYRAECAKLGFTEESFTDLSHQLTRHYGRVREELKRRYEEITKVCSSEYVDRMIQGLGHWIEGGEKGRLAWGIFVFRKA